MKIWFSGWLKYKHVFASSFNSAPWQPDWAVTLMRLIAYSGLNSRGDSALLIGGSCTRGESIGSTFSLLSSLLFPDIPHRRVKTGNTKLDSESIIRPIYQLGSLCSKNKHITALQSSSPSLPPPGTVSTSSVAIRTHDRLALLHWCCLWLSSGYFKMCSYIITKLSGKCVICNLILVFTVFE